VLEQQPQYADARNEHHLQFLYERPPLSCAHPSLRTTAACGCDYDHRHAHHLRCLLEEVFGAKITSTRLPGAARSRAGPRSTPFTCQQRHAIHVFKNRSALPAGSPPRRH
jgi:hypothetical protein